MHKADVAAEKEFDKRCNTPERFMCIACDHEFKEFPYTFVFTHAFVAEPSACSITGVCEACERKSDDALVAAAAELLGGVVELIHNTTGHA